MKEDFLNYYRVAYLFVVSIRKDFWSLVVNEDTVVSKSILTTINYGVGTKILKTEMVKDL